MSLRQKRLALHRYLRSLRREYPTPGARLYLKVLPTALLIGDQHAPTVACYEHRVHTNSPATIYIAAGGLTADYLYMVLAHEYRHHLQQFTRRHLRDERDACLWATKEATHYIIYRRRTSSTPMA